MCGIVGYIGSKNALPMLLDGLKRLEYRGYDSAGVAILRDGKMLVQKKVGKVSELEKNVPQKDFEGTIGIGHTRWATHGEPSDINSHPHTSNDGTISMIHNGIIENYQAIKTKLEKLGYKFKSATDTEALVILIEEMKKVSGDLETAVRLALRQVEGTYGIAVVSSQEPDKIIAARKGSPLIIGVGDDEHFVASDAAAIIPYTRQVVYLEDGEIAVLSRQKFETKTIDNVGKVKQIHEVTFDIDANGILHVSAKDKATGKENKITIKANSGLSEAEIQQMEEDAVKYADEDKKYRELVDARNAADGMVHSVKKSLSEHGDKLDAAEKEAIEAAIKDVEEVLQSDDKDAIEAKTTALTEASQKLGEKVYAEQQAQANTESAQQPEGEKTVDGDVVDAEFEEVKKD